MNFKKCFMVILLLIVTQLTFAQSFAQTQATLPLQFNTGNPSPYGMPSTTIFIQGKKIPLILDIGAMKSELVLSKRALAYIKVKYTGKTVCFHAADGKICEPEFIVPEIKLGSFTIKNVKGSVMQHLWDSHNSQGFKVTEASQNGVIGLALLSRFNLLLDYPHSKAILVKPNAQPVDYNINQWVSIPFQGRLLSQIKLNGHTLIFGWDTGAIPSVIKQSAVKEFKQVPCPSKAPYATTGCSSLVPYSMTTVMGKSIPNTWFLVRDIPSVAPFDGLLGGNFFTDNLVYFDFQKHLIYVKNIKGK